MPNAILTSMSSGTADNTLYYGDNLDILHRRTRITLCGIVMQDEFDIWGTAELDPVCTIGT
jgi:hypothetical protein